MGLKSYNWIGASSMLYKWNWGIGGITEDTTSVMVAYRHFWTDDMRSSVFYGNTTTDLRDTDRSHWGVNIFKNVTKQLSFGLEVGNFEMANTTSGSGNTMGGDSNYVQFSTKFVL